MRWGLARGREKPIELEDRPYEKPSEFRGNGAARPIETPPCDGHPVDVKAEGNSGTTSGRAGQDEASESATSGTTEGLLFDPWNALQPPPFPIEALPPILRAFAEDRAKMIGADPCAIAWSALAACGVALDARIRLQMKQHDRWSVPPFFWLALVGAPSTKKTPILDAALDPLLEAQKGDLAAWRQEHAEWMALPKKDRQDTPEPTCRRRLISNDATIEAIQEILGRQSRGIGLHRDELSGWIGSLEKYNGGRGMAADRAFYLQAFNGGPNVSDRVARGMTAIDNLAVSIVGGIQPDRLTQLGDIISDGLWQRFLPIIVGPSAMGSDGPLTPAQAEYRALIERLLKVDPTTVVRLSQHAHEIREDVAQRLFELEQSEVLGAAFSAFCGKLIGIWGRICLVLSQIDPDPVPYVAPARAADAARTLVFDSALPHAARIYAGMGGGGGSAEATQSIAGFILTKRKNRVLASDLTSSVRACRGASLEQVQKLVSPLVAGGWLTPERDFGTTAWIVAGRVHHVFAARAQEEATRRAAIRRLIRNQHPGPDQAVA